MKDNLLTSIMSLFNQDMVKQAGAALGESGTGFDKALRTGIPAILAGLMERASSSSGLADLFAAITGPNVEADIGKRISAMSSDPQQWSGLLQQGESMLSVLFGDRASDVAGTISQVTGAGRATTMAALATAAPAVLGMLKNLVVERGLSPAGLATLLGEQRDAVLKTGFDKRVAAAIGWDASRTADTRPVRGLDGREKAARAQPHTLASQPSSSGVKWWPWAAGAAAVAVAVGLWANWPDRNAAELPLPTDVAAARAPSAVSGDLPASLYFDRDQTLIGADARDTIEAVADAVRGTDTSVAVTGYADEGAEERAASRAAQVRDALLAEGVADDNVVLMPPEIDGAASAEGERIEISLLQ